MNAKEHHLPQLDGIRALAVSLVIYFHWLPATFHFGIPLGQIGVKLFFVLSGFLITGILLRHRDTKSVSFTLKSFYIRRCIRLVPVFYLVLTIACVANVSPVRESVLWHLAYLSNVYIINVGAWSGPVSHFWTLAVEEQFYLLWPLLVLYVPRPKLSAVILAVSLSGSVFRITVQAVAPESSLLLLLPVASFETMGFGAMLAIAGPVSLSRIPFRQLAIVGMLGCFATHILAVSRVDLVSLLVPIEQTFLTLMLISVVAVFITGLPWFVLKVMLLRPVQYVGKISYGLYIIHMFAPHMVGLISAFFNNEELNFGYAGLSLRATCTLLFATLSWYLLESPINRLKVLFPYQPLGSVEEKPAS